VESLLCIAGHRTAAQNKNPMQKKIIWVRLLSQNLNCQYSKKFKKVLLEISVKSPSIQNLGFNLFLLIVTKQNLYQQPDVGKSAVLSICYAQMKTI
jgi:hypothetical protein